MYINEESLLYENFINVGECDSLCLIVLICVSVIA